MPDVMAGQARMNEWGADGTKPKGELFDRMNWIYRMNSLISAFGQNKTNTFQTSKNGLLFPP
jgi:hypothetical protein